MEMKPTKLQATIDSLSRTGALLICFAALFTLRHDVLHAGTAAASDAPEQASASRLADRRDWWSLVPVEKPQVPAVKNDSWSQHPIDRFVLSGLEAVGLPPSAPAEPRTFARRLSLLLTGLPPTPAEVERYCQDTERDPAEAYDQLVTRLLESPHFGERWARHWMDVVRFAETYGYEWNFEIRDAWRYRDYLIRAFNADLPYDQLVREHLAGDLLPDPRINEQVGINESLIGTAFFRFSETGHDDGVLFPAIRFDPLDNQIDTLSKAFQAATISCARCHDHKLDAISTVDYYALVGILESSRQVIHTLDLPDRIREPVARLREQKVAIRQEISKSWLADLERAELRLQEALAPQDAAEEAAIADAPVKESGTEEEDETTALLKQLAEKDIPKANPTYLLQQLAKVPAAERQEHFLTTWRKLADEYAREQAQIQQFHADNFESWGDFRQANNPGWEASGLGLVGNGPSPSGEFTIAAGGDSIVPMVLPAGQYTHLVSDKLNGTVRSPWLPKQHKYVSLRFLAGGLSMVRAVMDSCVLGEFSGCEPKYCAHSTQEWKRFTTGNDSSHQYYLELATKSVNPRWPERDGNEQGMDAELRQSPRSWFGVVQAVLHDCEESPREELSHFVPLFALNEPRNESAVAKSFVAVIRRAVEAFRDERATDDDVPWINWALSVGLLGNSAENDTTLANLVREFRELEDAISPPRVVVGMADQGPGFDFPVLQGGNPTAAGPLAPRRYLQVLARPEDFAGRVGSGRLELAHSMASRDNPLTARVMVNRVWQHLFGTGIVNTPDDFGRMGELPSHPELLDYLAAKFVEDGWSVKRLIRHIVSSRTFQQASAPLSLEAQQRDAGNRLLHHYPVFRLDAEAVRDSILTVSGRLDRTSYGPSIQPYRTEEKLHRKLTAGPLDGNGRRSIYIKVTRMEGNKFLELFDLPDPMATRGRRDRTNVPAQALALLNDPFLIGQAQVWADRLVVRDDASADERIQWMYLKALGRGPSTQELDRMRGLVDRLAGLHQIDADTILDSPLVWKDACHAMFNTKELIYVW